MAGVIAPHVDRQRRFGGVTRLYGIDGTARIFQSHVVVVGIGGVGSWSAEALARSGVGQITLIDMDHVSESNINRQVHSLDSTLGKSKIDAMRARIADINPTCKVQVIDEFVTPENWQSLCVAIQHFAPINAVLDACDEVVTKTSLAAWALTQKKIFFVTVGAAGGKQQAELVQICDLSQTTHDPLLAKMRYNLRRHYAATRQGMMGVTSVYSQEPVVSPALEVDKDECTVDPTFDSSLNCHGYGSAISVTATFGLCAAGWIIRALAKSAKREL